MTELQPRHSEFPPELQPYVPQVRQFINEYQEIFYAIARDRSLRFKAGPRSFIDFKAGEINVGVDLWQWGENSGLSLWQKVWANAHEITHFGELRRAPEELLGNFEYLERRAHQLAPQVLDIWKRKSGGKIPDYLTTPVPIDRKGTTKPYVEVFVYKQLHRLYNSLDDIYVNKELALRSPVFAPDGSQGQEVKRLYRDYLFPTNPDKRGEPPQELEAADCASRPKSVQLADVLLRYHMVPDQTILTSPEVQAKIKGYADQFAQERGITLEKEIEYITNPGNTKARSPAWRHKRIRQILEPIFVDFFLNDLEEQPLPQEQKGQKGEPQEGRSEADQTPQDAGESKEPEKSGDEEEDEGEQAEEEGGETKDEGEETDGDELESTQDPWQTTDDRPDSIDIDTVREFIKQQKEKKKEEKREQDKERLTPEERAQSAQAQIDEKICQQYDVDPNLAEEYREFDASVEPYKKELAAVFEELMQTISQQVSRFWAEGFKSGKFNINRFIRKYGPLLAAERPDLIPWDMLDVYDQREFITRLVLFPNRLTVRLVLDGSGSMNKERIMALKQLCVLFLEGLSTFEATVNLRFRLKESIAVDTEIWMFGSQGASQVAKPLAGERIIPEEERANRFSAFGQINADYGKTCDAEPFWQINESIDSALEADLNAGKAKELIFEITDGGSNETSEYADAGTDAAQDTRNAIAAVETKGAVARGFQIGEPDSDEKATFDSIWGDAGAHTPHPKDLAPSVAKTLANEIRKTRFQINYYGVNEDEFF